MNTTLLRQLVDMGLVEMKWTGEWGLTKAGREVLDSLELLRMLDDRPAPPRRQQPRQKR